MKGYSVLSLLAGLGLALVPLSASAGGKKDHGDDGELHARLNGAQEVTTPAGGIDTEGRGRGSLEFSSSLAKAEVELSVSDLVDVVGAHIHCAGAGQNGPIIVDLGVSIAGPVDGDIVDTTIENADIAAVDCTPLIGFPVNNIASLQRAAAAGLLYMNVHTGAFQNGEIRGQLLADD